MCNVKSNIDRQPLEGSELFPQKDWGKLNAREKEFFREMPKEQILSRWLTPAGERIREQVIELNANETRPVRYNEIIGTVKTDWGKKPPKFDLRGINLSNFGTLEDSDLWSFDLSNCSLQYCNLSNSCFTGTNFVNSDILYSNLRNSYLACCNFRNTNLTYTSLEGSRLGLSDFSGSWINEVVLDNCDLWKVKFNSRTRFRKLDLSNVSYTSNPFFITYVQRYMYLENFRDKGIFNKIIYWIWFIMSDCGQSFSRWLLFSFVISSCFGFVFSFLKADFEITLGREPTPFTFYYYSVVTFTTLGFGDIIPKTLRSEILVTIEVIIGYIMLGGLIGIFSSKFIPPRS